MPEREHPYTPPTGTSSGRDAARGPATNVARIVYVEDSEDEVFLTRIVFGRERVSPELVHYARFDALERDLENGALPELAETLFVLDLNLKVSKGTDAVRRLRTLPVAASALIGVCTGSEDPADRRDAEEAGADFFVGKPLDAACLSRICHSVPALEIRRAPGGALHLARRARG